MIDVANETEELFDEIVVENMKEVFSYGGLRVGPAVGFPEECLVWMEGNVNFPYYKELYFDGEFIGEAYVELYDGYICVEIENGGE